MQVPWLNMGEGSPGGVAVLERVVVIAPADAPAPPVLTSTPVEATLLTEPSSEAGAPDVPVIAVATDPTADQADVVSDGTLPEISARKERDVSEARQLEEVKIVGKIGIERIIQKISSKLEGKNENERAEILAKEPEHIQNLYWASDPNLPAKEGGDRPLIVTLSDGSRAVVLETYGRTSVSSGDVKCRVEMLGVGDKPTGSRFGSAEQPYAITAESVFQGQFVANSEEIIQNLPQEQQEATRLYVKFLKEGEKAFEGIEPSKINEAIKTAGDSLGLITAEDLELFTQNYYQKLGAEAGANQEALKLKMENLLDRLDTKGINLADPETVSTLLFESGAVSPEQLDPMLKQIEGEVKGLSDYLKTPEGRAQPEAVNNQLNELRKKKKFWDLGREGLKAENIEKFFANMETGEVSEAHMQANKRAIRSADSTEIIEAAFSADTRLAKDFAKSLKKEDREKLLKSIGKRGVFMSLAMLFVMYSGLKGSESQAR